MKNEKRYVVYCWKNRVNNKCYIGITTDPNARKRHHIQGYRKTSWLHQAIKKHGIESFDYEELETNLSVDEALEKERHYIVEYNSFGHGYNQTPGGYFITGPGTGENHHSSTITEDTAKDILNDPCSGTKAVEKYGVSRGTVNNIRLGKTWTHLDRTNVPEYENGKTKITADIARAIFLDPRKHKIIAEEYGLDVSVISYIKIRKRWKSATKDLDTSSISHMEIQQLWKSALKKLSNSTKTKKQKSEKPKKQKSEKPKKQKIENAKSYAVYRIINTLDDKVFIGVSSEPKKRMTQILSGHGSRLITLDIEKYGSKIFMRQIVDRMPTLEDARKKMQTLILRQNSLYPSGYNMTLGGQGSHGHLWSMDQRNGVRGVKNGRNKLTEVDVLAIFWDNRKRDVVAKEFGISKTMVSKIKNGLAWNHVTGAHADHF